MKKRIPALALLLISIVVVAATFTIDTTKLPYLGHRTGTSIHNEPAARMADMRSLAGFHNNIPGVKQIVKGDIITYKWSDGSSEKGLVDSLLRSDGVQLIPGSETSSSSGGGGGGFTYDPYEGGGGFGEDDPFAMCFTEPRTACIRVGGGPWECTVVGTNIVC